MELGRRGVGYIPDSYIRSLDPVYLQGCQARRTLRDQQYSVFHTEPLPADWESRIDEIEAQITRIVYA